MSESAAVESKTSRVAAAMSEAELQDAVIELAQWLGYRVAHFRPARTEHGWRTPVAGDGKGFPDLVLVGRGRVVFAELKSLRGSQSRDQREWMIALRGAGADYRLWTPADWVSGRIEKEMR